ncbi:SH3 domain-containing protein [Aquabacter cavernae]|uniref:SH3 domain-containing protein n=1 Tax=Aquabacter cavernae TaxID=2496029 RepID=UPI00196B15A7|nr:SH3 domain-containing protein [Aquabacter cavernae]
MGRSIGWVMAGVLVALSAAPAFAASAVVLRDLNVRAGPGTNFRVIGSVRGGTNIEVVGCTPAWCSIAWPNAAFVSAAYLGFNGPPPYASGPVGVPVVPAAPIAVPVPVPAMPGTVPGVPLVVAEPQASVVVVPPPPVYYGPPSRVFVNPPGPVPGYYGAWGVWGGGGW